MRLLKADMRSTHSQLPTGETSKSLADNTAGSRWSAHVLDAGEERELGLRALVDHGVLHLAVHALLELCERP